MPMSASPFRPRRHDRDARRLNFDIYLPAWLAEYNKAIFGSLYVIGIVWTLVAWLRR